MNTFPSPAPSLDPSVALIVDSGRSEYLLTESTILPALRHWGMAFKTIDLASEPDLGKAAAGQGVVLIAQEYLGEVLGDQITEIAKAQLEAGGAFVNLDHALFTYPASYFDLIGASGAAEEISVDGLNVPNTEHPVLQGRTRGAGPRLRLPLPATKVGALDPSDVLLESTEGHPLLFVRDALGGRLVQWLLSPKVWNRGYLGLAHGLDAFLWKAIAWSAPKPFVMNAMRPYVRFRFDDCYGHWQKPEDLGFVEELNALGYAPSICFCFKALTPEGIEYLSQLQRDGKVDLAPHTYSPGKSFFYGDDSGEYSEEQFQVMFSELDQAKEEWNVDWSTILSDHEHEWSKKAVPFLRSRGIRHKMNILLTNERWSDPHIDWHPAPYGSMSYALDYLPGDLDDFFAVFNHHPSFDTARVYTSDDADHFTYHRPGGFGRQKWDFMNGLVKGTEPESKDLEGAIDRLVEQTEIGLDALFFGGSITHSHFTRFLNPGDMTKVVKGANERLEGLEQIPTSYDEIADYAEAKANTEVVSAKADEAGNVAVDLSGRSWRELKLSVFTDEDDRLVRSEVTIEPFEGTTTVVVPSAVAAKP